MNRKWWYWFGLAGLLSLAGTGSADSGNQLPVVPSLLESEPTLSTPTTPGWRAFSSGWPVPDFVAGAHDPALPLITDPGLSWNTFLGSPNTDDIGSIAVDGDGNVYVIGTSYAAWGSPLQPYNPGGSSGPDAFVAKLDPSGTLLWNTFLGSSSDDFGHGIALDSGGNVYVAGDSNYSWGSPLRAYSGGKDAFVAKLDPNGTLLWNTFLGGDSNDAAIGIAVGSGGNVYVTGYGDDAFVAKLDTNGALLWNTFLGGDSIDVAMGIAVDSSGNVYVTGISYATWGSPLRTHSENCGNNPFDICPDAFVAKLGPSGALLWNTFIGGSNRDGGISIAVDNSSNVYVAGISYATWESPLRAHSGETCADGEPFYTCVDAFVAKLDLNGALLWNTFLGSDGYDEGTGIAVGSSNNIYVSGHSWDTWGNPTGIFSGGNCGFTNLPLPCPDAFVAKLDTDGALLWNTFLGGNNSGDEGYSIAVDSSNRVYIAGKSNATWSSPVRPFSGRPPYEDVFVAKISNSDTTTKHRNDFNGDGKADILWRNTATGENWLYLMDGNAIQVSAVINQVADQNWKVAGVGDFDGDAKADILWRNSTTGENWIYLMDGADILESHPINTVADLDWQIVDAGDFDGDARADILWHNLVTGENWMYLMDGAAILESHPVNTVSDLSWKIVGVADFDGDHKADILWRNSATGENWLYLMNGATIQSSPPINSVPDQNWKIAGVGDFDGNGQADILWRNSSTGENWSYLMNGANIQDSQPINTVSNLDWKIVDVADFDGNGQADILWRNSATGENWLYLMDGSAILQSLHLNTVADLNWQIQGGGF